MTEPTITESIVGTAQNLLKSKIVGSRKDHPIGDSAVYGRILRDEAQNRSNLWSCLMPLEDYRSLTETKYLLSSPANAARLIRGIEEIEHMIGCGGK
jgi:hypothetical protein